MEPFAALRQPVETIDVHREQGRHLIEEGASPARASAVHAGVDVRAGAEEYELGVLTPDVEQRPRGRMTASRQRAERAHLLDEREGEPLGESHSCRTREGHERHVGSRAGRLGQQRAQRVVHPGFVATVGRGLDENAAVRKAEEGQFGGGGSDVDAERQGLEFHGTPQR